MKDKKNWDMDSILEVSRKHRYPASDIYLMLTSYEAEERNKEEQITSSIKKSFAEDHQKGQRIYEPKTLFWLCLMVIISGVIVGLCFYLAMQAMINNAHP